MTRMPKQQSGGLDLPDVPSHAADLVHAVGSGNCDPFFPDTLTPSYPRITPTTNLLPVQGLAAFRRDRFGPGVSGIPNVASSRHTSPTAFAAVTATSSSHAALR